MSELLQVPWVWYPSVVIGFTLWTAAYMLLLGTSRARGAGGAARQLAFHAGTLLGLLSLVSPVDALADTSLFSAHMLQHLLLMFGMAPLWLLGLPAAPISSAWPAALRNAAARITTPAVAWVVFAGVMWIWHVPQLFELTLRYESLHIFEHLTLIGGALIGWWPIVSPTVVALPRPAPPSRMLYIFFVALACTALAALLTFSAGPLYPQSQYVHSTEVLGLSTMTDQRLGGLMMWLPTHMILLLALGVTFFRWFTSPEPPPRPRPPANSTLQGVDTHEGTA